MEQKQADIIQAIKKQLNSSAPLSLYQSMYLLETINELDHAAEYYKQEHAVEKARAEIKYKKLFEENQSLITDNIKYQNYIKEQNAIIQALKDEIKDISETD